VKSFEIVVADGSTVSVPPLNSDKSLAPWPGGTRFDVRLMPVPLPTFPVERIGDREGAIEVGVFVEYTTYREFWVPSK